ncbi:MAG TPA: VWA domain-containing protein [Pyrinomonadaceae bacterium]|jgi:Ca-activated chloride channel family protein|nr:VWA domain-containing protein [Pyrinomonadaceae bacterium]
MLKKHQFALFSSLLLLGFVIFSLTVPAVSAQQDEDTIRVNSNLIPVAATVVDARGGALADLKLEDFELLIDGEKRPISAITRSETPVRMAVLYDNSGSLNKNRHFERSAAATFFRSVLRAKDSATLYAVSTDTELIQPLTGDVELLVRAIKKMGWPSGGTALYDGVNHAAEYLRAHPGRRVIVIISDGADTRSTTPFNDTLRAVQSANCQVYVVRTGHSDHANNRDLTGERRLEALTAQTGGSVYAPSGPADLEAAFASIAADLAAQYILSYYAAEDEGGKTRFHPIELRVPAQPEARIRVRKGYYSPGT